MSNYDNLVSIKQYGDLYLHKYKRKVFYDNLWNTDPRLLDARGLVLDKDGNIVSYPFTKIFNYKENETVIDPNHTVLAIRKVNGFMACASLYKGEVLISTTGSLDSAYVWLAKELLPMDKLKKHMIPGYSYCFEIVHPADLHIIKEEIGAYLIGIRKNEYDSPQVNVLAKEYMASRLAVFSPYYYITKFKELLSRIKTEKYEGYVVYDEESDTVLKIKTPYYLVSKFIARTKKLELLFDGKRYKNCVEEEFYPLCEFLQDNYAQEQFAAIAEQDRLAIIRKFFEDRL